MNPPKPVTFTGREAALIEVVRIQGENLNALRRQRTIQPSTQNTAVPNPAASGVRFLLGGSLYI